MIILEGPDCGGKSTLAVHLAERFNAPITHYSKHDDVVMRNHAEHAIPGTGEIVDRFHLSEPPYSMYHRHDIPSYDSVTSIDNILAAGNNLVILCIPPWVNVKTAWEERLDLEIVKNVQTLHGIYRWYYEKAPRYRTPHMVYDYEMHGEDEIRGEIKRFFMEKVDG